MSHAAYGTTTGHGAPSLKGSLSVFTRIAGWIAKSHQTRAAERHLHSMDDRQLTDIGLSRSDIHDFVRGIRHQN